MPYAHALQSWAWAEQKARWGWTPIPLTLTISESSWEPLAAAMVLKRKLPRTPYCILYVPKGPALDYKDGALRRVVLAELENIARRERAIFIKIDPEVVKSWGDEVERPSPLGTKFTQELKDRGGRFSEEQIQFRTTAEIARSSWSSASSRAFCAESQPSSGFFRFVIAAATCPRRFFSIAKSFSSVSRAVD